MIAYYNEIDPYAAEWLRNLIRAGHIADGDVDERSIEDVCPADLKPYTQCHFFAGIGCWSYALRLAGWADDRPVWTGSCPCQPFSAAGKGAGFADERHLWPAWHHLIRECRPAVVFGEQVASQDGYGWLDLVQTDMEGTGYAFGPVVLPAAGVGAPHQRHRLFFVGHPNSIGSRRNSGALSGAESSAEWCVRHLADGAEPASPARLVAHGGRARLEWRHAGALGHELAPAERSGAAGWLADDDDARQRAEQGIRLQGPAIHDADGCGAVRGWWAGAEWIACRDGRARPVEPGTFPLVDGTPRDLAHLRAYGNAIVPQAAAAVIGAYLEAA